MRNTVGKDIGNRTIRVGYILGSSNFLRAEVIETAAGKTRLKLASVKEVRVQLPDDLTPDGSVTAVVRPEYSRLIADSGETGDLQGLLENMVYFGTDTHYHIRLPDQTMFVARMRNQREDTEAFSVGQSVGIAFKPDSVQVRSGLPGSFGKTFHQVRLPA